VDVSAPAQIEPTKHWLVKFPNGETRALPHGRRAEIAKGVIERFTRRFLRQPAVVRFSHTRAGDVWNDELTRAVGILPSSWLSPIILADLDPEDTKFIFVELGDRVMTVKRKRALLRIAESAGCDTGTIYFLTAFRDRRGMPFRNRVSEIAWGTFAWFVTEEEKLLEFRDGESAACSLAPGLFI
jgi:hypothetical protein